jgi:hypothetical protein
MELSVVYNANKPFGFELNGVKGIFERIGQKKYCYLGQCKEYQIVHDASTIVVIFKGNAKVATFDVDKMSAKHIIDDLVLCESKKRDD